MKFPYNETVLEHFKNPKNVGKIENADGKAMVGSPACGDMVALYIKVDEATKVITDIKFESYGCASNIATGVHHHRAGQGQDHRQGQGDQLEGCGGRPGRIAEGQGALLRAGGRGAARGDHQL